ncbi:hypothetical protein HYPSUDRAFT_999137 [Hypholoma sublateritium FD-334 SS-4]|uniref:Uncharacterized protein n=1 Tax=Hypholoma sublateritium (strain FD-334 SS-4) TaxID=945553 RepID=A0A0D2KTA9_HYPSF|nr:hypothetical protein HYPSUDRAFT_999137 [Hypholoma sublateritium FD-334 SS-4]
MEYFVQRFIRLRPSIEALLHNHESLGSHTSVVLFQKKKLLPTNADEDPVATLYFWSHVVIRPLGHPVPMQCSSCHVLRPWKPKHVKDDHVVHGCKTPQCGEIREYQLIEGDKLIHQGFGGKDNSRGSRGLWHHKCM